MIAEWEPKLSRNLRPKFPKLVVSNVQSDVDSYAACRWRNAALRSRMIEVAERYSTDFAQPLGKVEHGSAVVVVCNNGMSDGMQETPLDRALADPADTAIAITSATSP